MFEKERTRWKTITALLIADSSQPRPVSCQLFCFLVRAWCPWGWCQYSICPCLMASEESGRLGAPLISELQMSRLTTSSFWSLFRYHWGYFRSCALQVSLKYFSTAGTLCRLQRCGFSFVVIWQWLWKTFSIIHLLSTTD